jgi:hypothetical protein
MSATKQMKLASTSKGRVLLHLLALARDHRVRWHLAGVARELHHEGRRL